MKKGQKSENVRRFFFKIFGLPKYRLWAQHGTGTAYVSV